MCYFFSGRPPPSTLWRSMKRPSTLSFDSKGRPAVVWRPFLLVARHGEMKERRDEQRTRAGALSLSIRL